MMMNFTVDCVRGHKDGVLLLITADAGRGHSTDAHAHIAEPLVSNAGICARRLLLLLLITADAGAGPEQTHTHAALIPIGASSPSAVVDLHCEMDVKRWQPGSCASAVAASMCRF
jgi:hypothetical protein